VSYVVRVQASESALSSKPNAVDTKEIENLLKLGAYHMFLDDQSDKKSAEFCAEDIDQILEKSSKVVTVRASAFSFVSQRCLCSRLVHVSFLESRILAS